MASISAFSLSTPTSPFSYTSSTLSPPQLHFPSIKHQTQFKNSAVSSVLKLNKQLYSPVKVRAVTEEEEALVSGEEIAPPDEPAATEQTVSVAVSPSDVLKMFFQAEGTMTDSAVPAVAKALEEIEGVTDLKVQVIEGIASVELTKETTVQATGVASNLVEIIQGSGFKLQTLNLSFQDEEDLS